MLIYSLLHLAGYGLPLDQLKQFRQLGSLILRPPGVRGHRRCGDDHRPAGAGIRHGRGHGPGRGAPGRDLQPAGVPDLVDHYVYAIGGDGCMQEKESATRRPRWPAT